MSYDVLVISEFGATKKVPAKKTKFPAPEHTKGKDDKIEDKGRKKLKENYINNLDKVKDTEDSVKSIGFIPVPKKLHNNSVSKEILHSQLPKSNIFDQEDSDEENEKRIEENEQFIIELLSKTQPHHDHCYTTIFGKRKNSDYVLRMLRHFGDEEIETIDASNPGAIKRIICLQDTNGKTRKPTPILFLRHRSPDENVPMVSKEEIIDDIEDSSSDMDELIDVESGGVTTDQTISRGESKLFLPVSVINVQSGQQSVISKCRLNSAYIPPCRKCIYNILQPFQNLTPQCRRVVLQREEG